MRNCGIPARLQPQYYCSGIEQSKELETKATLGFRVHQLLELGADFSAHAIGKHAVFREAGEFASDVM